ncbi:MAG: serine protease [Thermoleophilia bacterium]|nr:serine protease [Thermoleophilia bacterium]
MIDLASPYLKMASRDSILVQLDARPDLAAVSAMPRGPERKDAAWDVIRANAEASQAPMLAVADALMGRGLIEQVQSLASPNMLIVTPTAGHGPEVYRHFQRDGVAALYTNLGGLLWSTDGRAPHAERAGPAPSPPRTRAASPAIGEIQPGTASWGVGAVGAPAAWARGADGTGMVYGSIDGGVQVQHEALRDAYRGATAGAGGATEDDYSWLDLASVHRQIPYDPTAHGTHTTGTAVGDKGIGVAPGATWIAVNRGFTETADSYLKALQWMQAPTRRDGSAPDATKAPDVVGMSWYYGRVGEPLFEQSFQNLLAAGVELVKSAGNTGPGGRTISAPGHMPEAITVGSVRPDLTADPTSSRGPAQGPDGVTLNKPDLAAPGEEIVSALPDGTYAIKSGTSMAQPHVAGAALILLGKYPQLTHAQLVEALTAGAVDLDRPGWDAATGAGLLNIPASLDVAARLVGATAGVAGTQAA